MKKQNFLNASMVMLGISVLMLMIACPSPSKDSGSAAKVDSDPRAIPKGSSFSSQYTLDELAAILPSNLGNKTVSGKVSAVKPADLVYTLYYVKVGHTVAGKTADDKSTAADLFAMVNTVDKNVGKVKGVWNESKKSFDFNVSTTLHRGADYRYFVRPSYPVGLVVKDKPVGKLPDSKVEPAAIEIAKVTIALTFVGVGSVPKKNGTFAITATEPSAGGLGKKTVKGNTKADIGKEDLVYTLYYAKDTHQANKKTASSSSKASDLVTIIGDTANGANVGAVKGLSFTDLTLAAGVNGLIALVPGNKYYYFIRTAYKPEIDTKIASDSEKDTIVKAVVLAPLSIKLSSVGASGKDGTFQVTATEQPSGAYLGRKTDDGRTLITLSELRYTLYYAKHGFVRNTLTISNKSISIDNFVKLVGSLTDANAGKIENLTIKNLKLKEGVKGLEKPLVASAKYYFFVRTAYAAEDNMPDIPKNANRDTGIGEVVIAAKGAAEMIGKLVYDPDTLTFSYKASGDTTITPTSTVTTTGVAYAITKAGDGVVDDAKVTIGSSGVITVAQGLLANVYKYTVTISKSGSISQVLEVSVTVTPLAPGKATVVKVKTGSVRSDEFVVEWTAPSNLGGDVAKNMVYTVYYKAGGEDLFSDDAKKKAYINDGSSAKVGPVLGDGDLEVKITGLTPKIKYVFFVVTENKNDLTKVSYSAAVAETTSVQLVVSVAVLTTTIAISAGRDKIKVTGAAQPDGETGAFGKKASSGSKIDITKGDFKYEIYYAKEGVGGIGSSSDAKAVKAAVDAISSSYTKELGKTGEVSFTSLVAVGGIVLLGSVRLEAGSKYRVFIRTIYPSSAVSNSYVGVEIDTKVQSVTIPAAKSLGQAANVDIKSGTIRKNEFVAKWTAPTELAEISPVDIRYTVYYKKGSVSDFSNEQSKKDYIGGSAPSKSTTVVGNVDPLEIKIASLTPNTKYVFFVVTKHKTDVKKISYSSAVAVTTLVASAAVTVESITISAARDKIQVSGATAPDGMPDAFGKKNDNVDFDVSNFKYKIYYALEGDASISSSSTAEAVKTAVDNAHSISGYTNTAKQGVLSITTISRINTAGGIAISSDSNVKFKAGGTYRVFIRTVYPVNVVSDSRVGVEVDTEAKSVVAPNVLSLVVTTVKATAKSETFRIEAVAPTGDLGKRADGSTSILKSDLRYTLYYAQIGLNNIDGFSDAKTVEGITSVNGKHGKISGLLYAGLEKPEGVKGLLGLDANEEYRYFIRTSYASDVGVAILTDWTVDTAVSTVVTLVDSAAAALPSTRIAITAGRTKIAVDATAPVGKVGAFGKKSGGGAIDPADFKYEVYYALDTKESVGVTIGDDTTAANLKKAVDDAVSTNSGNTADFGKIAAADLVTLNTSGGQSVGATLTVGGKYRIFILTVYPTGEPAPAGMELMSVVRQR